jgi:glycosyltransferase involved in cell wall biosynthesis
MTKHIVIDARSRPSGAGSGRYIDRLLSHLQEFDKSNKYTVLLRPADDWTPTAPNFTALPCPFRQFSFNPLDQLILGRFLRKLRPDLVHFGMSPQEPMFYFGKRLTTAHDLTMFSYVRAGKLPGWLHALRMVGYRLLFWWSLRRARQIIVPSQFVAKDIGKKYPFSKEKITVTYEASEPPIEGAARRPKQINEPFILHVGSPFPHKNVERLVDAFVRLKQIHPKLQLVLAGKKEQYFEKLESLAKKTPVFEDIIFTGFASDPELKWLYQHAEAYVLPSLSEGFGLVGLEAMVHGCPLISSNATCLPEIYGDAALYFDPNNSQDMARQIDAVLSDNALQKSLVKNGYVRIKKYSWKRMAEQTLEVYEKYSK